MIVVVEDAVSEAVARILLRQRFGPDDLTVIGRKGRGYVEARSKELCRTAEKVATFILVDQDRVSDCPVALAARWFGRHAARFLTLQVAVFEVESWLLADAERVAAMLRIPEAKVPRDPDEILDPKGRLVSLARRSRIAEVRDDLVPVSGSTAAVGPGYNARVVEFVNEHWRASVAARRSPSLARALRTIAKMKPT